ncbi:putative uncharacterized protein [Prevotella sp. CAG:1124]|nr:putative uncharacterized protein [Prevotella sp. CAG:1124]
MNKRNSNNDQSSNNTAITTEDIFKKRWQKLHHPTMDVNGDVTFYYGVYKQFHDIAKGSARNMNEYYLLQLVMLVENTVSVDIDSSYSVIYRSLGNMAFYWCDKLDISTKDTNLLYNAFTQAVADAPESSLKQWIKGNVLSGDFQRLKDVALYFAIQDKTIRRIYPNLQYRKDAFLELAGGDNIKAKEMLESDLAFNWHDKEGCTLLSRLADSFKMDEDGMEVIANLETIKPHPLDSYLPFESKDDGYTVTVMKKDNTKLDVIFPTRVSKKKIEDMCFVGQLVTYLGKTYINGPIAWLDKNEFDLWDSDIFFDSIHKDEEENAKHKSFTTKFGNRYTLYQDLYGEFDKDINGFYTDEPNIRDFLNFLGEISERSERSKMTSCENK